MKNASNSGYHSYVPIAGSRHPAFFGRPFSELFPGQEDFSDVMKQVDRTGRAIAGSDDTPFYVWRDDKLTEEFYAWNLIPRKCRMLRRSSLCLSRDMSQTRAQGLLICN